MEFKEEQISVGFRADKTLIDKIDKIAEKEGVTRSRVIKVLLEEALKQYEKKWKKPLLKQELLKYYNILLNKDIISKKALKINKNNRF